MSTHAAALRLPPSVTAWREVLKEALALPTAAIRVPPHFGITIGTSGEFLPSFGPSMPVASGKKFRESAIAAVLMPLRSTDPLVSSNPLFELAGRCSGGGAFRPAGQPKWCPTEVESQLKAAKSLNFDTDVRPYEGIDLVMPLTQRGSKMRAHSSQISLPGGGCDPGETPQDAALRESREEIDLDTSRVQLLGQTSRLFSYPSKAFVHPCVGLCEEFLPCRVASPDEVESIHYLSLGALLLDPRFHGRIERTWKETGPLRMPAFHTSDGQLVWGLTAFAIGELVARVGTVLRHTVRLPAPVLRHWGDGALSSCTHVKFANPYADAQRMPKVSANNAVDGPPAASVGPTATTDSSASSSASSTASNDGWHPPQAAPSGSKL